MVVELAELQIGEGGGKVVHRRVEVRPEGEVGEIAGQFVHRVIEEFAESQMGESRREQTVY